jgi:hypothetical protein
MNRWAFVRMILVAGLLAGGAGCSTFERDWRAAFPATGIEGRWEGRWSSDVTGHSGRLQGLVTRRAEGGYEARFHAHYKILLPLTFNSTVPLSVEPRGGVWKIQGDANLGWLFGQYHYDGTVSPTNFFSTYSCSYDRGTFQMVRPKSDQQALVK